MRSLLNTLAFTLLCASVCAQTNGPSPLPSARELQQRHLLAPEQAMQKVQQFIGNTDASVMLEAFLDSNDIRYKGTHYLYAIKQGPRAGKYAVSALDGQLLAYQPENYGAQPASYNDAPVLSVAEAQNIAEQFLRVNYPGFVKAQWELLPLKYIERNLPSAYSFGYCRIVNPQTGARFTLTSVDIEVNATDGTIQRFDRMPDYPYNGPSVPQVSREQAIQIAAQFAPYDVSLVPFDEVSLQIEYNMYQIPYLTWRLHQKPPVFDSRFNSPGYMSVDAMTGRLAQDRRRLAEVVGASRAKRRSATSTRTSSHCPRLLPSSPSAKQATSPSSLVTILSCKTGKSGCGRNCCAGWALW